MYINFQLYVKQHCCSSW